MLWRPVADEPRDYPDPIRPARGARAEGMATAAPVVVYPWLR